MTGYTGSRHEPAGIVHYGEAYIPCSCGEIAHWKGDADGGDITHPNFDSSKSHSFLPGRGVPPWMAQPKGV